MVFLDFRQLNKHKICLDLIGVQVLAMLGRDAMGAHVCGTGREDHSSAHRAGWPVRSQRVLRTVTEREVLALAGLLLHYDHAILPLLSC